jgi:ABC-2 type transport system ATP-binding protein
LEVGYMPQKFGLYEDLTVWENLTLHADLRGLQGEARDRRFGELLDFTDLHAFTGRLAGRLSGGMKQKLGLACALLGNPRLLLLDEPGVGVDPVSRRELWRMVTGLVDDGMAVVWSTAYLDEAEACAETLVLHEGKCLFSGTPEGFTAPLLGRCWWLREPGDPPRHALVRATARPDVCDGTVQGRSLRLTLRPDAAVFPPAEIGAPPAAEWIAAPPRFEDAFIDRLGPASSQTPLLAKHLHAIPADGATVIEADGLTKCFGSFTAADHISFQVRRGEIFGLLGPNGAGKSTTFKMMCGLLKPSSGRAVVAGVDLRRSPSQARQKLGYMAQKFSLYGNLSVLQNLEFFAGIYGLDRSTARRQTAAMTEILHLGPFLHTRTDALSLGYKQRLALACALMHEPEILFLDEPTSGVDPVTRREFWSHIHALVSRGVTVMVTTHFMDEAEYCDRIGLIFRGQWMAGGSPDDLKRLAAHSPDEEPTMEEAFIRLIRGKEAP